jgi:hypothetical protein
MFLLEAERLTITEFTPDTVTLEQGLKEEFEWYRNNLDSVYNRKPYMEFIDNNLAKSSMIIQG